MDPNHFDAAFVGEMDVEFESLQAAAPPILFNLNSEVKPGARSKRHLRAGQLGESLANCLNLNYFWFQCFTRRRSTKRWRSFLICRPSTPGESSAKADSCASASASRLFAKRISSSSALKRTGLRIRSPGSSPRHPQVGCGGWERRSAPVPQARDRLTAKALRPALATRRCCP